MKKILTAIVAALLLCSVVFSMASCGVDMTDVKSTIKTLEKQEKVEAYMYEGAKETGSEGIVKQYYVRTIEDDSDDVESITIVEYAKTKLAKLSYEGLKLDEKFSKKCEKLGDDPRYDYDTVLKRKGKIVISGSKALYEEIFG